MRGSQLLLRFRNEVVAGRVEMLHHFWTIEGDQVGGQILMTLPRPKGFGPRGQHSGLVSLKSDQSPARQQTCRPK